LLIEEAIRNYFAYRSKVLGWEPTMLTQMTDDD
jgi:hypothetical protein